jgi:hypothetical protein
LTVRFSGLTTILATPLVIVAFIGAAVVGVNADDAKRDAAPIPTAVKASVTSTSKKEGKARPSFFVTPEREAAVINFVQRNHAELADLLIVLKTSQPEEYERALREIFRATERMNQIQERDPLQYELEVAAWTAQSRVQLLAAKLKMNESEELMKKLRDGLKAQNEAKLALLKHDRQKVADRLSKIDSDISRYQSDREDLIEKQLNLLTSGSDSRPAKASAKASVKATNKPKAKAIDKK